MNSEITTVQTVHDLRHRWKPHKERFLAAGGEQATSIRFHRACSWMARVERIFVLVAAAYGPNATFLIKLNLGAIHGTKRSRWAKQSSAR